LLEPSEETAQLLIRKFRIDAVKKLQIGAHGLVVQKIVLEHASLGEKGR
jgi:hypothetical protein